MADTQYELETDVGWVLSNGIWKFLTDPAQMAESFIQQLLDDKNIKVSFERVTI
jgi:hypothetical protein